MAFLMQGGGDEALSATVVGGGKECWIVTGNNWNFRTYHISENSEVPVPIKVKANSLLKGEHKFAVVETKGEDGRWTGKRYALQDNNTTINLDFDAGNFVVSTSPSGHVLTPEAEKTYDPAEKASRKEKINFALTIASTVLSAIGTVAAVAAL